MDLSNMIPFSEWANNNGIKPGTARQWLREERFQGVKIVKVAGCNFIPKDTPVPSVESPGRKKGYSVSAGKILDNSKEQAEMISKKLKELRKTKGIKQNDVALAIGVTASRYGNYEQGIIPPFDRIEKIADFYGIKVEDIMGE